MTKITKPLLHVDDDVRSEYHPSGVISLDIKTDELSDDLKALVVDTVEAMVVRLISAQRKYQHGDNFAEKEWAESGELAWRIADRLHNEQTVDALNLIMFSLYHDSNPGRQISDMQTCIQAYDDGVIAAKAFIDSTCPPGTADEAFKPLSLNDFTRRSAEMFARRREAMKRLPRRKEAVVKGPDDFDYAGDC